MATKKNITGQQVWDALKQDEEFQQAGQTNEALQPFVEALPEILADLLDQPVSLTTLNQAKIAYLRYCLDNGFAHAMVEAMSAEMQAFEPAEELSILSDEEDAAFKQFITEIFSDESDASNDVEPDPDDEDDASLEDVITATFEATIALALDFGENLAATLSENKVTEQQVMLSQQVNLNPTARRLYLAGELTIEMLLTIQPALIVKNTLANRTH